MLNPLESVIVSTTVNGTEFFLNPLTRICHKKSTASMPASPLVVRAKLLHQLPSLPFRYDFL
jgi:hypothetical protein